MNGWTSPSGVVVDGECGRGNGGGGVRGGEKKSEVRRVHIRARLNFRIVTHERDVMSQKLSKAQLEAEIKNLDCTTRQRTLTPQTYASGFIQSSIWSKPRPNESKSTVPYTSRVSDEKKRRRARHQKSCGIHDSYIRDYDFVRQKDLETLEQKGKKKTNNVHTSKRTSHY